MGRVLILPGRQQLGARLIACAAAAGLALVGSGSALASAVRPDPSFGAGGVVNTRIPVTTLSEDEVRDVLSQPDGKLLVVGGSNGRAAITRFDADGSVDSSFGDAGTAFGPVDAYAFAGVALEANGDIVATAVEPGPHVVVDRFDSSGAPDPTFGSGGEAPVDALSAGLAVSIEANGTILVGGSTAADEYHFAIAAFGPDGSRDQSFGDQGVVTEGQGEGGVESLAVGPNDQIAAAGNLGDSDVVARYDADGTPDSDFGTEGVATHELAANPAAVLFQPNGKVLVGGDAYEGLTVSRLKADGSLDGDFGTDGTASASVLPQPLAATAYDRTSLDVLPSGDVLVAGVSGNDFALARFDSSGQSDEAFGSGGVATTSFGGDATSLFGAGVGYPAIAVQPSGRIIEAGTVGDTLFDCRECNPFFSHEDIGLAGYTDTGAADSSFGNEGKARTNLAVSQANHSDDASGLLMQPDGDIVATGRAVSLEYADFALARYRPDGSLDPSFGEGGKVDTPVGSLDDYEQVGEAGAAALAAGGKIVATGCLSRVNLGCTAIAIARYEPDGALDESFGEGGIARTLGFTDVDAPDAVATTRDGDLLVLAGVAAKHGTLSPLLLRYRQNGTLDPGFGSGGVVQLQARVSYLQQFSLLAEPNGRLVVALGSPHGLRLIELRADGSPDRSFGEHGAAVARFPGGAAGGGVLLDGRRLLEFGRAAGGTALARFHLDGRLDRSFGHHGRAATSTNGLSNEQSAVVMPSGKIVIAGTSHPSGQTHQENRRVSLLRFDLDGSPDRSFGGDGRIDSRVRGRPTALSLDSAGRLVVAGTVLRKKPLSDQFMLARFTGRR